MYEAESSAFWPPAVWAVPPGIMLAGARGAGVGVVASRVSSAMVVVCGMCGWVGCFFFLRSILDYFFYPRD